jgi:hypothetical protein
MNQHYERENVYNLHHRCPYPSLTSFFIDAGHTENPTYLLGDQAAFVKGFLFKNVNNLACGHCGTPTDKRA